jgi:acetyl esterase/lipase
MKQFVVITKRVWLCVLICVVAVARADYPSVEANVPYAKVAELTHQAWSSKYQYGEHSDQFVLHWQASPLNDEQQNSNKAVLVFIHGGCWLEQFTIEHSFALTSAFAQTGFEVFSIEYRRTGNGGEWPIALDDIMLAVDLIDSKLTQIRPNANLVLVGHSAGGHLASLAANKKSDKRPNVHFIGLAPIMDIVEYAKGENSCQTATPAFMKGTPDNANQAYLQANPVNYKMEQLVSATVFAGGRDSIVPVEFAQHETAKIVLAEDAGHFDWIHPGSQAFKRVLAQLDAIESMD